MLRNRVWPPKSHSCKQGARLFSRCRRRLRVQNAGRALMETLPFVTFRMLKPTVGIMSSLNEPVCAGRARAAQLPQRRGAVRPPAPRPRCRRSTQKRALWASGAGGARGLLTRAQTAPALAHRNHVHERRLAGRVQANERQLHFLLEKQAAGVARVFSELHRPDPRCPVRAECAAGADARAPAQPVEEVLPEPHGARCVRLRSSARTERPQVLGTDAHSAARVSLPLYACKDARCTKPPSRKRSAKEAAGGSLVVLLLLYVRQLLLRRFNFRSSFRHVDCRLTTNGSGYLNNNGYFSLPSGKPSSARTSPSTQRRTTAFMRSHCESCMSFLWASQCV